MQGKRRRHFEVEEEEEEESTPQGRLQIQRRWRTGVNCEEAPQAVSSQELLEILRAATDEDNIEDYDRDEGQVKVKIIIMKRVHLWLDGDEDKIYTCGVCNRL